MSACTAGAAKMREAGLTLVELMVALTLGLFLSLGLVLMMGDSSRTFKIQDDYARMQESAVSALRYLADSLRHSGFYGLAASTLTLEPYGTIPAIENDCGDTLASSVPLFGYAAASTPALTCIRAQNFRAPSPILVVRLGTGLEVIDDDGNGSISDNMANDALYLQSDANFGYVFKGSEYQNLVAADLHKRYANGEAMPVFPYQMHVYYVRPCSRPTGADAACQAGDDAGNPIPTLVRQELEGTRMVERPLAEGVERLHFMYGLDTLPAPDGDGIPDRFVADPCDPTLLSQLGMTCAQVWAGVVAVRVALLVRSPTPIAGHDDSGKCYDMNGSGNCDPENDPTDFVCRNDLECRYKRALFSQLIQLRNVAYRRGA